MPVDLSVIPPVAKRKKCPSLKYWSLSLMFFILCGVFITLKLWPTEQVAGDALFWQCLIGIPIILWLAVFSIRWLAWLVSEWQADGWDREREADIGSEIKRGQRFLILEAVNVRLPHVMTSETLAEQFQLPHAVIIPVLVDETTHSVTYQARFNDVMQPAPDRTLALLISLIEGARLKAALAQHKATLKITTIIQIDTDFELSNEDIISLDNRINKLYPLLSPFCFSSCLSLEDVDKLLDEKPNMDNILILSVRLLQSPADGDAEAGVALLLHGMKNVSIPGEKYVRLHRPERTKEEAGLRKSAEQSIIWGRSQSQEVSHLWLSGLGVENNTLTFLAKNNLKFSTVDAEGTFIDIDMKSGNVGKVSPWLAIALAAENAGRVTAPQLVMSMPDTGSLPWWLIIHST